MDVSNLYLEMCQKADDIQKMVVGELIWIPSVEDLKILIDEYDGDGYVFSTNTYDTEEKRLLAIVMGVRFNKKWHVEGKEWVSETFH